MNVSLDISTKAMDKLVHVRVLARLSDVQPEHKAHSYARSAVSLQSQLIDRALQVGAARKFQFSGDAATWLREMVESTVARLLFSENGVRPFDQSVQKGIDLAFKAVTAVVAALVVEAKNGAVITATWLEEFRRRICPLPPIC